PTPRDMSPPPARCSILITSAPMSARWHEPYGPAPYCSTARMRRPSKGSFMRCLSTLLLASYALGPAGSTERRPEGDRRATLAREVAATRPDAMAGAGFGGRGWIAVDIGPGCDAPTATADTIGRSAPNSPFFVIGLDARTAGRRA